jgi:hypothetical protein
VRLNDPPSSDSRRDDECRNSSVFPLFSGSFVSICLIMTGLLSIRHAVYNRACVDDASYYVFIAIGAILMIPGLLLIPAILSFLPESPIPHLCLV